MQKRLVAKIFLSGLVVALGVTAAAADTCQDAIAARQKLMKRSGAMAKVGSGMIRGDTPFDPDKTKEIFAAFADDADQMPSLFPECSKAGNNTAASPAIWQKPDDFKALIAKFSSDIKSAQANTTDVASLKTSFATIGKDCSACHNAFVIPGRAP